MSNSESPRVIGLRVVGRPLRNGVKSYIRRASIRVWAIWAAYASRLLVTDFTQAGAGSARGTQSMLGWYKDDARYGRAVTDSSFEIRASGPAGSTPITRAGTGNRYEITALSA